MSKQLDEPAFPINSGISDNQFNSMTLRDYFAGQVINGLMAHHGYYLDDAYELPKNFKQRREYAMTFDDAAKYAYGQADDMLAERAK